MDINGHDHIEYLGKKKAKILLVDDRPENLVALEKVLVDFEVEFFKAESGNEALVHILHNEFALALLDVQMPGMDGYELAEIIRSDPDAYQLPIIFISAIFTDKLNVFRGYEKGAFSFIAKPFDPIELQNKVKFFVQKYHTEKAYAEQREKFMDLYNNSPDMLLTVNIEDGLITECNKTLVESTGYEMDFIIGQPFRFLIEETSQEKLLPAFEVFDAENKVENLSLLLKRKDGSTIEILLNANKSNYYKDLKGLANISMKDISELKQVQTNLIKAVQELENHNNELKSFLYLTSHDLQEPMLTVLNFNNLLREELEEQLSEDAKKYIDYSVKAANRMRELITGLLNYLVISREDTLELVDVNDILTEIQDELKATIDSSGAKFEISEMPSVMVVRNQLKQLFQNLISNAIKFSKEKGQPMIKIWLKQEDAKDIFCVKDNGIGISKDKYEKVFGLFQQLHNRGEYEGLGIGMAICKKIVEHHNGELWLDSEVGVGTTFYFTLGDIKSEKEHIHI